MCSNTFLGQPGPAAHSTPVREERPKQGIVIHIKLLFSYILLIAKKENITWSHFDHVNLSDLLILISHSDKLKVLYSMPCSYKIHMLYCVMLIMYSSSHTDSIPTYPSTTPQSLSRYTEYTPTAQPHLSSTLISSSPIDLHAKLDLGQTLSLSPPSDYPSQLTGPAPVSAPSINQPQPQSSKGSRVLRGHNQASDETPQQMPFPNLLSTTLPSTVGCR